MFNGLMEDVERKMDFSQYQKQPPEVFCKKRASKSSANLTEKHLCWSLFLIKLQTRTQVFSCQIY